MNTETTYQTESTSSDRTEQLGATVGARLRGGEVIALSSDLGGGKTAFVRGLAKGMGSQDHVASPTFTIGRQYSSASKNLTLYHFDFYRLSEPGLIAHELADAMADPTTVIAIEWGGIIENVLPVERLAIDIRRTGEDSRAIEFACPKSLGYLLGEVRQC